MDLKESKKETLILEYIGEDDFSMPMYRDQFGYLWKDVELEDSEQPCLYSVVGNRVDGDPNEPITRDYTIRVKKAFVSKEKQFQYQMLGRLIADCEYYLGYGYRNPDRLWTKSEEGQIEEIRKIWNSFSDDEKPEWLTWKQIEKYERDIVLQKSLIPGAQFIGNKSGPAMKIVGLSGKGCYHMQKPHVCAVLPPGSNLKLSGWFRYPGDCGSCHNGLRCD
ncbi:hypothetical protein QMP26_19315 [Enterocloster clostridioformis]